MPVFRINIAFANRTRYNEHHIVDGVDLDTYYRRVLQRLRPVAMLITSFDVVQISELTREALFMRANKIKRMSRSGHRQPRYRPTARRRRF